MPERRKSRVVTAGNVKIGGNNHIPVQSMLNGPAEDAEGNVKQALELQKAGCEIIRLTVPNKEAVKTLAAVKEKVSIPVVADIHFDYRCALESVAAGADKIRINPGNIGSDDRVKAVADAYAFSLPSAFRAAFSYGKYHRHSILPEHPCALR